MLAGLAVGAPVAAVAEDRPDLVEVSSQTVVAPVVLPPVRSAPRASRADSLRRPAPVPAKARGYFAGMASWYGGSFHGRRTASGEIFDTTALTAASRTLPFGTRLEVCRADRCVVVRINDRGPFVKGRVLDVSRAASQALGFSGVAHITATPLPKVFPKARASRTRQAPQPTRASTPPVATPAIMRADPQAVVEQPSVAASVGMLAAGVVGTAGCGFRGRTRPRLLMWS